jgi:hypothetical protein
MQDLREFIGVSSDSCLRSFALNRGRCSCELIAEITRDNGAGARCLNVPNEKEKQSGVAIRQGHTVTAKRRNDAACVLAEAVRAACVETALLAYEDAGLRGLCQEGRWEHALAAIRRLDLRQLTSRDATVSFECRPAGSPD